MSYVARHHSAMTLPALVILRRLYPLGYCDLLRLARTLACLARSIAAERLRTSLLASAASLIRASLRIRASLPAVALAFAASSPLVPILPASATIPA